MASLTPINPTTTNAYISSANGNRQAGGTTPTLLGEPVESSCYPPVDRFVGCDPGCQSCPAPLQPRAQLFSPPSAGKTSSNSGLGPLTASAIVAAGAGMALGTVKLWGGGDQPEDGENKLAYFFRTVSINMADTPRRMRIEQSLRYIQRLAERGKWDDADAAFERLLNRVVDRLASTNRNLEAKDLIVAHADFLTDIMEPAVSQRGARSALSRGELYAKAAAKLMSTINDLSLSPKESNALYTKWRRSLDAAVTLLETDGRRAAAGEVLSAAIEGVRDTAERLSLLDRAAKLTASTGDFGREAELHARAGEIAHYSGLGGGAAQLYDRAYAADNNPLYARRAAEAWYNDGYPDEALQRARLAAIDSGIIPAQIETAIPAVSNADMSALNYLALMAEMSERQFRALVSDKKPVGNTAAEAVRFYAIMADIYSDAHDTEGMAWTARRSAGVSATNGNHRLAAEQFLRAAEYGQTADKFSYHRAYIDAAEQFRLAAESADEASERYRLAERRADALELAAESLSSQSFPEAAAVRALEAAEVLRELKTPNEYIWRLRASNYLRTAIDKLKGNRRPEVLSAADKQVLLRLHMRLAVVYGDLAEYNPGFDPGGRREEAARELRGLARSIGMVKATHPETVTISEADDRAADRTIAIARLRELGRDATLRGSGVAFNAFVRQARANSERLFALQVRLEERDVLSGLMGLGPLANAFRFEVFRGDPAVAVLMRREAEARRFGGKEAQDVQSLGLRTRTSAQRHFLRDTLLLRPAATGK